MYIANKFEIKKLETDDLYYLTQTQWCRLWLQSKRKRKNKHRRGEKGEASPNEQSPGFHILHKREESSSVALNFNN